MVDPQWLPPADLADAAQALLAEDPLHESAAVADVIGDRYPVLLEFGRILAFEGERRGLLGPREYDRLWERHLLNSAALLPYLPPGVVADIGSGAGLPGVVIAALQPERTILLVEPMERRVEWLRDAVRVLGLENAEVIRARADELGVTVDVVTARAVAPIDKLVRWCGPLLAEGGQMVFLKGRSAADEVDAARFTLRKAGLTAEVIRANVGAAPRSDAGAAGAEGDSLGLEPTTVVRLRRAASA